MITVKEIAAAVKALSKTKAAPPLEAMDFPGGTSLRLTGSIAQSAVEFRNPFPICAVITGRKPFRVTSLRFQSEYEWVRCYPHFPQRVGDVSDSGFGMLLWNGLIPDSLTTPQHPYYLERVFEPYNIVGRSGMDSSGQNPNPAVCVGESEPEILSLPVLLYPVDYAKALDGEPTLWLFDYIGIVPF